MFSAFSKQKIPTKRITTCGRTEYQTIEDGKRRAKNDRAFSRSPSKRFARRTVGGHTRNVILEEKNFIDGYRNIPKSQTFSGSSSSQNSSHNQSFNRYDGVNNQMRATLPHDYKIGSASRSSIHSEKSDE
ncbi:hypothetical protein KUTeg_008260 [Tegillarca granosa]|uniref:FERM adjacent domain-containing protein n=1 Tax=Tegillarca granosa TaxID=220873 RepID=A0ABQ9F8M1_TEGGR|nr:hypothetical protein KUTeg_008260 [Tegillarca granosa]